MNKRYKASTDVSVTVYVGQSPVRVAFTPQTGGGSIYYTDDAAVQQALARHSRYGSLFYEDKTYKDEPPLETQAPDVDTKECTGPRKIKVDCLDDAREFLSREYGISRTKLRTNDAVKAAAKDKGIEFEGI